MEQWMHEKLIAALIAGSYSAIGAFAQYFYSLTKTDDAHFRWGKFVITGFLGFFLGQIVGGLLPLDFVYRDGTLLISGFLVYQLLEIIETRGAKIFARKFLDDTFNKK